MGPLTNAQLIAADGTLVFARWYKPEAERQPGTAWQVRAECWARVSVLHRKKARKHTGQHLITVTGPTVHVDHDSRWPAEQGHEIDSCGHVYFFASSTEADCWEHLRRHQTMLEVRSLGEAIRLFETGGLLA